MPRALEVVGSALGLLVLGPLLLAIAVAVKFSSPGPVIYRADRVGQYGRRFTLLKFRTMRRDADRSGPGITVASDARITRVGSFLREHKLDELPQLINVLRGDMSLVGPRPEDPRYVALYSDAQMAVLSVRPGITSPASLAYFDESSLLTGADWEQTYVERIMPAKLNIELEYLKTRSLFADVRIILRTVFH
jgi:lipopolysaccharide/colanic/teichoic acid biosynthesis glycosyltransferase